MGRDRDRLRESYWYSRNLGVMFLLSSATRPSSHPRYFRRKSIVAIFFFASLLPLQCQHILLRIGEFFLARKQFIFRMFDHDKFCSGVTPRLGDVSVSLGEYWVNAECTTEPLSVASKINKSLKTFKKEDSHNLCKESLTKRQYPGLVIYVPAVAYHITLKLPVAFTKPG